MNGGVSGTYYLVSSSPLHSPSSAPEPDSQEPLENPVGGDATEMHDPRTEIVERMTEERSIGSCSLQGWWRGHNRNDITITVDQQANERHMCVTKSIFSTLVDLLTTASSFRPFGTRGTDAMMPQY
ncbi:hypothetical protein Pmani_039276 [Petrolisthes manimaculis]|uniref:Uncharacterized protein n=1 Tax=Petrolisthes manimaculis TaxID=1843537 RepID=A0AAE1NCV9_9EUCA|nr:hypothetical protein Pmani_039276 [Petrolisthes manimaculis]